MSEKRERERLLDLLSEYRAFARDFVQEMERNGEWDDGCFYYQNRSATMLGHFVDRIRSVGEPRSRSIDSSHEPARNDVHETETKGDS